MKPKMSEKESNAVIITEFEAFLRALKFDTSTSDSNLSTVRKCLGHLFLYEDSMLNFFCEKIPGYDLGLHFDPHSDGFLEVRDPTATGGWIQSLAGPSGKSEPSRRKEMLKCHARWRQFVIEKLEDVSFGSMAEAFYRKEIVIKNLIKISEKISQKKVFSQLTKLESQARTQKQRARQILFPSQNFKEQNSVKMWFESAVAEEEETACLKIYHKSMAGGKISQREFLRFGNYARFTLALEDRNRRATYGFSNEDFSSRIPKWLPPQDSQEIGSEIDRFGMIPDGYNADVPPELGDEPSCWVMLVCGDQRGLKGGRQAEVVFTKRSNELCLKFKDLKSEVSEDVKGEDNFFVNAKGKPLAPLQRTPGSLLDKLGIVCDLSNPTINTFRRAAETVVQSSPQMKKCVENLQSHSANVGLTYYDRSTQNTRAQFINQLSAVESPNKAVSDEAVSDDVKKRREVIEEAERMKTISQAKLKLAEDKKKKKEKLSKKCKVEPEDRSFLQEIFSNKGDTELPDDASWRKMFYRYVDTKSGEEGKKLRKIEEKMFAEQVKKEVEEELGDWCGLKEQNNLADAKISLNVKSSFRVYEKSKKPFDKSYFKF